MPPAGPGRSILTTGPPSGRITRRTLLVAGVGAAAVAGLESPAGALAGGAKLKVSPYRRSTYLKLVGTEFRMEGYGGASVPVQLVRISNTAFPRKPDARVKERAFQLHFEGPGATPLAADIYGVHHPEIGSFDLSLSSANADGADMGYVAVVNNAKVRQKLRKSKATRSKDRSYRTRRRRERKRGEHKSDPVAPRREPKPRAEPQPEPQPVEPESTFGSVE